MMGLSNQWFLSFFSFHADSVKLCGGRVLIHCYAGISRSATVCLAYLMKSRNMRLEEAFEFVRKLRTVISPNLAFMLQLSKYEAELQEKENTNTTLSSRRRIVNQLSVATTTPQIHVDGAIKKAKMSRDMNLSFSNHSAATAAARSCLTRSVSLPVVNPHGNKAHHGNQVEGQRFVFNFGLAPPSQFGHSWSSSHNSPSPICSPSWKHWPTITAHCCCPICLCA